MFEGGLSLRLEGHDDKTHENVDHKEGNDDDVDEVENSNVWTVVVFWTDINLIRVYGHIENPESILNPSEFIVYKIVSYPGQPSKVATTNRVSIALRTLS